MATKNDITVTIGADDAKFQADMGNLKGQAQAVRKSFAPAGEMLQRITSLSDALPGTAGRAVGAFTSLAGVLASGGPLVVGIGAVVAGIGFVAKRLYDAQQESEKFSESLRDRATKALESYAKTVEKIRREGLSGASLLSDDAALLRSELIQQEDRGRDVSNS